MGGLVPVLKVDRTAFCHLELLDSNLGLGWWWWLFSWFAGFGEGWTNFSLPTLFFLGGGVRGLFVFVLSGDQIVHTSSSL